MATLKRLSNIAQIKNKYDFNPSLAPLNSGRDLTWAEGKNDQGQGAIYSTVNSMNSDGTLMLLGRTDNCFSVCKADGTFIQTLPGSQYNPIGAQLNPRWSRTNPLGIFWCGDAWDQLMYQPLWSDPIQQLVCKAPAGWYFIDNGQEADLNDTGLYMAVKISNAYTGGHYQNVQCGVVNLRTGTFYPGRASGNPNAIDISPSGTYMLYANHDGDVSTQPNRLYRISSMANGLMMPLVIDSAITNNFQSIGHHGWAITVGGMEVFIYQDNRDDTFKCFVPLFGRSTVICTYLDVFGQWQGGHHIARVAPDGKFLLSTYDCGKLPDGNWHEWANSVVMVDIADWRGKSEKIGPLNTARNGYYTEAWASYDKVNNRVLFPGNMGGLDNLECWAYELGAPPIPQVPFAPIELRHADSTVEKCAWRPAL